MWMGTWRAISDGIIPPLLCITMMGISSPSDWLSFSMERKYASTIGRTYALMTVLLVRSYSRISGSTLLEMDI